MTPWLRFLENPVIFILGMTIILFVQYLLFDAQPILGFWSMLALLCVLSFALFQVVSLLKQQQNPMANDQLYRVFERAAGIEMRLGSILHQHKLYNQLGVGVRAVRQHLAESLGLVTPVIQLERTGTLRPQECQVWIRGKQVSSIQVYLDHVAIRAQAVKLQQFSIAIPVQSGQESWLWVPTHEVLETDDVEDAITFMLSHLERLSIQHADEVISRTDVLKILALLNTQEPVLVETLFESGQLEVGVFKEVLVRLIQAGISIRDMRWIAEHLSEQLIDRSYPMTTPQNAQKLADWLIQERDSSVRTLPPFLNALASSGFRD